MTRATPSFHAIVVAAALAVSAAITLPSQAAPEAPAALPDATADRVLGQTAFNAGSANGGGVISGSGFKVPAGIAIVPDSASATLRGRLFVADFENYRVLSWPSAASFANGQAADLELGQPDSNGNGNFFDEGSPNAVTDRTMGGPEAVAVDANGNLFVADTLWHRVMVFQPPFSNYMAAARVFGQLSATSNTPNYEGITARTFNFPRGLALDSAENLYVADQFNHRVLIFNNPLDTNAANAVMADFVVGQPNLTSGAVGGGQSGIENPTGVALDAAGNLFVASYNDNRVLHYVPPFNTNGVNGQPAKPASRVFGQGTSGASFNTNSAGTSASAMTRPIDVTVNASGDLYVADQLNARVLLFVSPLDANAANATTADRVFGQDGTGLNFNSGAANLGGGPSATAMNKLAYFSAQVDLGPLGMMVDSAGNLYAIDAANHRVLAFDATVVNKVVGDGTPESCTESELESKLAGGGIITFACGGAKVIVLTGQKTLSADTTLDGGGSITLSGGNATQLIVVGNGALVTLRRLTLTNGYSAGDGGAIYNGGSLAIEQSTIQNSNAVGSGGAIVSYGPLAILNSTLAGNNAANAGAVYPRFPGAPTYIFNSSLRNNRATSTTDGWGGAILPWDGATVSVRGGEIVGNSARLGGGVHNRFGNSNVALQNVLLSGNTATDYGGGVYNYAGMATIINATLNSNSTEGYGGALYSLDGAVTINYATFSDNSASLSGGAILHSSVKPMIVKNTAFKRGAGSGNCYENAAGLYSAGFNVSDDNSCAAYLNQPGDKNNTDPKLGPLADNGGATLTHMPLPGSPLIDGGACKDDGDTDQRGAARPVGVTCDIGAVEYGATWPRAYVPVALR